jgi:penicillin-binding protein 1A
MDTSRPLLPRARRLGRTGLALALLLGACVKLPSLDEALAKAVHQAETSKIYAADGTLITALHAEENREPISLDQMPKVLQDAVISIEDERFWDHPGVDARAIARAFFRNSSAGTVVEGGSTITQQYIKNVLITPERTLKRKVEEAALAWQLEQKNSKSEILEKYLNTVYFGQGAYGVQAAAETYFNGIDASELNIPQAALLAGFIKSPGRYDPFADEKTAKDRRNVVLERMNRLGYLTDAELAKWRKAGLGVKRLPEVTYPAAYFVEWVKELAQRDPSLKVLGNTLAERINALFKGGLRIYTTVDLNMQRLAERSVTATLSRPNDPSAAFVSMDPQTGAVKAMVGGRDFFATNDPQAKFNFAVKAKRQPGSAWKPIVLAAGLEHGIELKDVFSGPSPISLRLPGGEVWRLRNYDNTSFGRLTLRAATHKSVNTVYAQVAKRIGIEAVVQMAERLGITSKLYPFYSLSIGAQEISPIELATVYSAFANGGNRVHPQGITKITDGSGKVIWEWKPTKARVITEAVAATVTDALHGVMEVGTGRRVQIDRPSAGKTGTTDEYHDAWFAGYVPQLVGVTWVGFSSKQIPMVPPHTRIRVVGGTYPGRIWKLFMEGALVGVPIEEFAEAPTTQFISVLIDIERTCLPNRYTPPQVIKKVTFVMGSEPTAVCTEPTSSVPTTMPNVVGKTEAAARQTLESAGYRVSVDQRACETYPPGYVCEQSRKAGTKGFMGDRVRIVVSNDSNLVDVPGVLGKTRQQAVSILKAAGFTVDYKVEENPPGSVSVTGCRETGEKGSNKVWLQTKCAGERLPRGSKITVYANP